ncbi:MAG TPA: adenylate cyclase [Chloroflexota bacterium]|nr:adenylate cyclase [Chloroflexota bacterium]
MKRIVVIGLIVSALSVIPVSSALAVNTGVPGQPNQDCEQIFPSGTLTPSGFNTQGFEHATNVYAGAQPQNSQNPKSVSQYDVACFQAANRPTH